MVSITLSPSCETLSKSAGENTVLSHVTWQTAEGRYLAFLQGLLVWFLLVLLSWGRPEGKGQVN